MNHQYKASSSHTLHPQLSQFFLGPNQSMQYPHYLPTHFDKLIPSQETNANDSLTFDSLAEPTKRIRHAQQFFSEAPLAVKDLTHRVQAPQKLNLPKNMATLVQNKDLVRRPIVEEPRQLNFVVKEELTIPDVQVFSRNNNLNMLNHPYQMMLQKLEQQRAQYNLQQQVLNQLEQRQKQFESMMKQQFLEQQFGLRQNNNNSGFPVKFSSPPKTQFNFEETDASSTADMLQTKVESSEEEENFQYIKAENDFETCLNNKNSAKIKEFEKLNDKAPQVVLQQKTQQTKPKDQNRNKNKSQAATIEKASTKAQEIPVIAEIVPKTRKPRQPKAPKPVDVPQHMQDDSNVDYQHLISLTITNDPAYIEANNSKTKFVVVAKDLSKTHETRVGDRYQVAVPEYKGPVAGKRRHPKPVWRPEVVKENELKMYFDDLRSIFSCDMINEAEALRLLKSKKYRREKVRVNIGKSKKFYEKVLVVPTGNEPIETNETNEAITPESTA